MSATGKNLFQLYKNGHSQVNNFFQYPIHPDWINATETILKNFKNTEFLKILEDQNKNISNPKYLNLLKQKNTVALVTGQQLGLFISPLYTIYKILTIILLADKLSDELSAFNFVPVFWLEAEDHDFDEINHAWYFDRSGQLSEVRHSENESETGYSISKRIISDEISGMLNKLQNDLIETDFSTILFDRLKKIWKPGFKWHEAFADQLQTIFKDMGLLIYNPADERVKKLSIPFFKYLIEHNNQIVEAFTSQSQTIKEYGFDNQVYIDSAKSYIFLSYQGGSRVGLQKTNGDKFSIKGTDKNLDKSRLLTMLDENPHWFSSTVLTRPIWQSWMLPVVSYIGGPSEIAYWAQLKNGFNAFKVAMPHVMPRLSYAMLEPKIQRLLNKYAINIDDIPLDENLFIKEQLQKTKNPNLETEFNLITTKLTKGRDSVHDIVDSIDPTLQSIVKKSFENVTQTLDKLHNRILRRVEEKESLSVQHFKEIHRSIYPNGNPQERVLSSIYFLNKYGSDWLNKLIEQTKLENFERQYIKL